MERGRKEGKREKGGRGKEEGSGKKAGKWEEKGREGDEEEGREGEVERRKGEEKERGEGGLTLAHSLRIRLSWQGMCNVETLRQLIHPQAGSRER